MEVAVESPRPAAWDKFKEEVEIMEEEDGSAAAGELLTREIKKRLLDHAHENGNGHGHANGGEAEELKPPQAEEEKEELQAPEEPKVAEEEQQQHKIIFFDAAKVPDIITEVSARYLVTGTTRSGAEKEDTSETLNPKGKEPEAHENGNAQEINHGPSNGKLENGSHSNGSHQVPNGAEPNIEYMFEINKTEIYPTEVDKDEHVTEAQPKVEEYDLQKILDQQETHDLYCPNCKSCITRRVILKKRKRTARPAMPDEPSKRPYTEVVLEPLPSATLPRNDEQESPDVFRCLSCFSFFIPTGGSFNIFRIFGRRGLDQQVDVLPPPASEDTSPRSENCTSWLLSCFQPGDSPNQPDPAYPLTVPLLSGTHSADKTTTTTESSTSYVHHSHGTVVKPEQLTVESPSENQAAPDLTVPLLSGTQNSDNTTTTTESSTSYVHHSHGMVVKPEQSTVETPSENQAAPDPVTVPLLSGTQGSDNTTTTSESSTSYVHQSHGSVVKPEQLTVKSPSENQAAPVTKPLLSSDTQSPNGTTITTESSTPYLHHSQGTVVNPEHSTVESSSEQTTTTITTKTTTATATSSSTTTSKAANTSSHTSSATGIFHTDTLEVITGEMPPPKPAGGDIMDANHHLLGHEDVHRTETTTFENGFTTHASHTSGVKLDGLNVTNITRGDIPTSLIPQAADPPHVAVSISEDVNPSDPRPQQMDDWDILKAIVYGGLVESVTSLSVVSAAASSGAKTLDIFILGIANLIGGLPLIFHNIADLRVIRDVNEDNERVGHYWLQLGRRSKTRLHMVMALLSYMVFGLLPPVLYGLSFRESNDRENKMMAVAAASLACIALLALGKAHVHRRPRTYFKTLMYYLAIAVSSSGLSYVAGELITQLLAHFGIIEQGGSAAPAPPGLSFPHSVGAQTSAWASF